MKNEEYKAWIVKSEDNIKWAIDNLKDENYVLVCYLCQQASEVILKGYIYFNDNIPPKIHDLLKLTNICKGFGLVITDNQIPKIAQLSEYYMKSRYPDILDPNLDDQKLAKEALEFAKEIVNAVKQQII